METTIKKPVGGINSGGAGDIYYEEGHSFLKLEDTRYLQLASLCKFMKALGYNFSKGGFRAYIPEASHMNTVSLRLAQMWHNSNFRNVYHTWHRRTLGLECAAERLALPEERMHNAIKAKKVVRTKLQYSKKREELVVTDHQVKYVEEKV